MPSPYFESASKQIDESKKGLLQAVATGGTAGKQAYDAAQAQAAQAKQDAVGRAANRSALYGVGGDDQTFLGAYDSRLNQMNVGRTNFESGLAQTQASGESYLEKARASIPLLEAQNIGKVTDQETKIKLAIEAAKARAQAEQEKEQRAIDRELARETRADARTVERENRADQRAAAKEQKATASKLPTADQLMGQGMTLADQINTALKAGSTAKPGDADAMGDVDNAVFLSNQLGLGIGAQGVSAADAARTYARSLGMDDGTINGILTPMKTGQWDKASAPAKDVWANALSTKYDAKGVTYETALSAINGQDFHESVKWIMGGADGKSRAEVEQKLNDFYLNGVGRRGGNPGPWLAEYEILVGEYLPRIPE